MTEIDASMNGKNNGQHRHSFDDVDDAVLDTYWQRYCGQHLQPSRLLSLGTGLSSPAEEETNHLEWCDHCRSIFERYRDPEKPQTTATANDRLELTGVFCDPQQHCNGHTRQRLLFLSGSISPEPRPAMVPEALRKGLRVAGPILFPSGEVAFESWQFGRIEYLNKVDPALAVEITHLIVDRASSMLKPRLTRQKIVLVCFGRSLHRLGTKLGAQLIERGYSQVHVVLGHDFYSPTLVCAPHELRGADVTVLVDVMHTGGLLERLFAVCKESMPAYIRGMAVIDQSSGHPLSGEAISLWSDGMEERMPIERFRRTASADQERALMRFEPNDEYAVGLRSENEVPPNIGHNRFMDDNSALVGMIHRAGALRSDYVIGSKRYPYVINVLDLFREPQSQQQLLSLAAERLGDLQTSTTCIAYHAGRRARAGKIAKQLAAHLKLPVLALGTSGPSFSLSETQLSRISAYRNIVIVDAAIRTGDSITAMALALDDTGLCANRSIHFFCILDALSRVSHDELSSSLKIDIRTLFKVPLAPPTERVRHWMNTQKARMRDELAQSGLFVEVRRVLHDYCANIRRVTNRKLEPSLDDTRANLEKATSDAHASETAVGYIDTACKHDKVRLIRHLPLDQVVHDRSVQDLLLGVMYNSMKPSFKEGAVFALAAACNYEWMTYDWLQCNRTFLGSPTHSWKSVLMVACQMKLDERRSELSQFREALGRFSGTLPQPNPSSSQVETQTQLSFADFDDPSVPGEMSAQPVEVVESGKNRLCERVRLLYEVASD